MTRFQKALSFTLALAALFTTQAEAQSQTKGIQYDNQSAIPCAASTSCMWIDTTNKQVNFYDGTTAKTVPSVAATTKGDLAVYGGATWAKIAAGTDGQCLQAQSGQPTGLEWGACSPGTGNFTFSGNTMDLSGSATMQLGSTNTTDVVIGPGYSTFGGLDVAPYSYGEGNVVYGGTAKNTGIILADGTKGWYIGSFSGFNGGTISGNFDITNGMDLVTGAGGVSLVLHNGGSVFPGYDATTSLGTSTKRWASMWSQHYAGSQTTAPTYTGGAGPTITVTGSDASMLLTFTTSGASLPSGAIGFVSYNVAYAVKPKAVIIKPVNNAAFSSAWEPYVDNDSANTTTGGFEIATITSSTTSTQTYEYSVAIIQ